MLTNALCGGSSIMPGEKAGRPNGETSSLDTDTRGQVEIARFWAYGHPGLQLKIFWEQNSASGLAKTIRIPGHWQRQDIATSCVIFVSLLDPALPCSATTNSFLGKSILQEKVFFSGIARIMGAGAGGRRRGVNPSGMPCTVYYRFIYLHKVPKCRDGEATRR